MKSQFEADKALNSLEIVGCVARTRLPSTFAVNEPRMRTSTTLRTVDEAVDCVAVGGLFDVELGAEDEESWVDSEGIAAS
jgi:hypothetical protein